jgi:hypothetical protein
MKSSPETLDFVKMGPIYGNIPWRPKNFYIAGSGTMYFAARQQGKGNPFLHLHGNAKQLIIVVNYTKTNSNKTGKYCSVATSTIVTQICHIITLYLYYLWVSVVPCTQIKARRLPLREFCFRNNQFVAFDLGGKFAPHLYHYYVYKHLAKLNYVRALLKTEN